MALRLHGASPVVPQPNPASRIRLTWSQLSSELGRIVHNNRNQVYSYVLLIILLFTLLSSLTLSQEVSKNLDSYFARARELEKREDYAGAQKIYQQALGDFPDEPEILKRLGIINQTMLQFEESIEVFQKILQRSPHHTEVNFYLGLSYFGLRLFDKAVSAFNKELEANPSYRRGRYYLSLALESLNRNIEAIHQLDQMIKEDPKDTKVLYRLARLHKSASLEAVNRLSLLDPDSDLFHALQAETYADGEKYLDAIREYQEVFRRNPSFPDIHFALGQVYWKMEQISLAEEQMRLALREDPAHPLANYYLAQILMKTQNLNEAIPLLQTSVKSDPQFMLAHFELGKCYLAQGNLQDALEVLLKAAELEPSARFTHYQLSQVYSRLDNPDKKKYHLGIFQKLELQEREKSSKQAEKLIKKNQPD